MIKQVITIGSLLAGGSGFALVAYMQTHPLAFTTMPQSAHFPVSIQVETPVAIHEAEPVIDYLPVSAFQTDSIRAAARASKPVVSRLELLPCSEWREVGGSTIQQGGAVD